MNTKKISDDTIDKSNEFLILKHFNELKVDNFRTELIGFEGIHKLKSEIVGREISEQEMLLSMIISLLYENLVELNTKEKRLEFYTTLTPTFINIYESFYDLLS